MEQGQIQVRQGSAVIGYSKAEINRAVLLLVIAKQGSAVIGYSKAKINRAVLLLVIAKQR